MNPPSKPRASTPPLIRIISIWGAKWSAQFASETLIDAAKREWTQAIDCYTSAEINTAIDVARQKFPDYPPTLGQFLGCFTHAPGTTQRPDQRCRFTADDQRCPAQSIDSQGHCLWHPTPDHNAKHLAALNYLSTNGIPAQIPEWNEVFLLLGYAGKSLSEARETITTLERQRRQIPYTNGAELEQYNATIEHLHDIRRRMAETSQPSVRQQELPTFGKITD